ncbi:MAG TPA: M23 family metallopeptidase [Gemmatimonadales bacterium]|jgi:murein DD-endopeptidase MepM/ murein hydrolase activator NlpD
MKAGPRAVTVVIQRDGSTRSQTFRVPVWALRAGAAFILAAVFGGIVVAALYGPLLRSAARVPGLQRQVARLQSDNEKVRQLSAALDSAESRYAQVRQMIGADIMRDPLTLGASLPIAPAVQARFAKSIASADTGLTVPRRWPLDEAGYITRGQSGRSDSTEDLHPGIDIAVSAGSVVRAAGGATVHQVGEDPEYGLFVLLDHAAEYQTMYGHLSRILVATGQSVAGGEVIGLSGNTGRSTAPHLHFEIRERGVSLDPRTMVKEGS